MFCDRCGQKARPGANFCVACGAELGAEEGAPAEEVRTMDQMQVSGLSGAGVMLLGEEFQSLPGLSAQMQLLIRTVKSLAREVEVLKEVLRDNRLWSDARYRELRIHGMVRDHGGPGPYPWEDISYYPHTLDDHEFLKRLRLTPEEIQAFDERVQSRQSMT